MFGPCEGHCCGCRRREGSIQEAGCTLLRGSGPGWFSIVGHGRRILRGILLQEAQPSSNSTASRIIPPAYPHPPAPCLTAAVQRGQLQRDSCHSLMVFWQLAQQLDHVHQCSPVCTLCKRCWQFLQHQLQDAQHCHDMLACSINHGQQPAHTRLHV